MPRPVRRQGRTRLGAVRGSRRGASTVAVALGLALTVAVVAVSAWKYLMVGATLERASGQVVPDFTLSDVRTSQPQRLSDHVAQVVVVVFCGTRWSQAQTYMPRLCRYSADAEIRRVDFVAINSNATESLDEVVEHARRLRVTFPILKDPENRVADLLAAECLGEALVIDRHRRLRYRGAIDDQFTTNPPLAKPAHNYLLDAIDAVLAGRKVAPDTTPVSGDRIERVAVVE